MWIRSLDEKLINLQQVEAIDLMDVFPDDATAEAIDDGAVPPIAFDLVAFMPSGWEAVLFSSEHFDDVERAREFLASVLASEGIGSTLGQGRVRTLEELVDHGRGDGRN